MPYTSASVMGAFSRALAPSVIVAVLAASLG
ncbi:MAG: hypothetical protein ACI8PT_004931, partial [Gammaproteobacteria bacterium]